MNCSSRYLTVTIALLTIGCGARTGLLDLGAVPEDRDAGTDGMADTSTVDEAGDAEDGDAEDGDSTTEVGPDTSVPPVPECVVAWGACAPKTPSFLVSADDLGQSPDVDWTGQHFLVVYDSFSSNHIAAVSTDGEVLWREAAGGLQSPRIAYHRGLGVGLMVADSGVRWLDGSGKPIGSFVDASMPGWQLAGDVSPTQDGFLVLSGAGAHSDPPPLYAAHLSADPSAVNWTWVADGAPRSPPEHALGPDGLVAWAASNVWSSPTGELYEVNNAGDLSMSFDLGPIFPAGGEGDIIGLATYQNELFVLYSGTPGVPAWSQWVLHVSSGESFRVDRSNNSFSGHLLAFADALLISSSAIHPFSQVSVGRYDTASGTVEPDFVLSTGGHVAHSARMTRWARGFAVVWSESSGDTDGNSAWMQIFECCSEEADGG